MIETHQIFSRAETADLLRVHSGGEITVGTGITPIFSQLLFELDNLLLKLSTIASRRSFAISSGSEAFKVLVDAMR